MKDIVNEILELFDYAIEKSTIDMKDYELKTDEYRKKLIKLFDTIDRID